MGYKMLNANSNYKIELELNKEKGIVLFDKRNNNINLDIDTFLNKVLIPLSKKIDDIFKDFERDTQREVNKNNANLSKKYDTLYNILDNKFLEESKKEGN